MNVEVDGEQLLPSDGSAPAILIEGDAVELEGLIESIQQAIDLGEGGGLVLTSEGVDELRVRCVE